MKTEIKRYIQELPDGKFRDVTLEELLDAQAKGNRRKELILQKRKLNEEINAIEEGCKHPVCYDQPGFPYDLRHCVVCGHISLI